jgi:hypothetical protein
MRVSVGEVSMHEQSVVVPLGQRWRFVARYFG